MICRICGLDKNSIDFPIHYVNKKYKTIYRTECLVCKHTKDNFYSRQKRLNIPEHCIWLSIKRKAKFDGVEFNLDEKDIVIPDLCPILGIKLEMNTGYARDNSPSVDRLIPKLGYTKGNCFIISYKANRMKQENTLEDLEKIIKYIKENLK